jgi:hypothetical protein
MNSPSFAVASNCGMGSSSLTDSRSSAAGIPHASALMQSVLLRGAAQRIKHLSRFLAERSLIFETTLHRIIVRPEWCFQRE